MTITVRPRHRLDFPTAFTLRLLLAGCGGFWLLVAGLVDLLVSLAGGGF